MATKTFRDRDSVLRAILERERLGLPLNCEAIKGATRPLYSAAVRRFGSWRNALSAAGIDAISIGRKREWDKAKILNRLREMCRQRRSLRQRVVSRHDGSLCRAACLHFGSWCNALVAAGINPEAICRDLPWDQTSIIEAILLRAVRSEPLGSTTVRPGTLKSAAIKEFGSWPAALAGAGLEPGRYLRQRATAHKEKKKGGWNKERVRKAILQRHALGLSLLGNDVLRDDRTLYFAGLTWFKRWSRALTNAGFDAARIHGNPQ